MTLDVRFTNSEGDEPLARKIAAGQLPKQVPIYYNCRFMADPTKPPELPEKNQGSYPGYVGAGYVSVPTTGGKVSVGKVAGKDAWPVGTHCLFSTTPPTGTNTPAGAKPVNVPGFEVEHSVTSNICSEDAAARPKNAKPCKGDYFWVHSGGEHQVRITQDLKRLHGQVRLAKVLTGNAQGEGIGHKFAMRLECEDEGIKLPVAGSSQSYAFSLAHGSPKLIDGVPAGANCKVIEEQTDLPNASVITPEPIAIAPITDVNRVVDVRVNNQLDFKLGTLKIAHATNFGPNLTEKDLQEKLVQARKEITVSCQAPGNSQTVTQNVSIDGDGEVVLPNEIPAGSRCSVLSRPEILTGRKVDYTSHSAEVVVGANQTKTVQISTTYSLPKAGAIKISPRVRQRPQYELLSKKVPRAATGTLTCGAIEKQISLDLTTESASTLEGGDLPENTSCTMRITLGRNPLLKSYSQAKIGEDARDRVKGDTTSFSFTSPSRDGALNIEFDVWFEVARAELTLTSSADVYTNAYKSEQKIPVPAEWKNALFARDDGEFKVQASLSCNYSEAGKTENEKVPIELLPREENVTTVPAPIGWKCELTSEPGSLRIPGADLESANWTIASSDRAVGESHHAWQVDGPARATLNAAYRMQLASFNVKKKVGGEGVAIVSGAKQFAVNISCALNGHNIPIPAPRKVPDTNYDAAATFATDLQARLASVAPTQQIGIGRFQQGEWNPVDAIPAGAKCVLEETDDSAHVDNTSVYRYWEVSEGYRGREPSHNCDENSKVCRPLVGRSIGTTEVSLPRDKAPAANEFYKAAVDARKRLIETPSGKKEVPANPTVPQTLPENFAGTMVVWNNYDFQKTEVQVGLRVSGSGALLMKEKDFSARLYCRPPVTLTEAEQDELPEGANSAGIIQAELQFSARGDHFEPVVAAQQIPVGYSCALAQRALPTYDTEVTAKIEKDPTQPTTTVGADQLREFFSYAGGKKSLVDVDTNLAISDSDQVLLAFRVHPSLSGPGFPYPRTKFTITDRIDRKAGKLSVRHVLDTPDGVGRKSIGKALLADGKVGYTLHYRCEDAFVKDKNGKPAVTSGSVELPAQSELQLFGTSRFMPASSTCTLWHTNALADPLPEYKGEVKVLPSATLSTSLGEQPFGGIGEGEISSVRLSTALGYPNGALATFVDDYFYGVSTFQVGTAVVGKRKDDVEVSGLHYDYQCAWPHLPGPDDLKKLTGKIEPVVAGTYASLPSMPQAATCKVSSRKPTPKRYVKMLTHWVDWQGEIAPAARAGRSERAASRESTPEPELEEGDPLLSAEFKAAPRTELTSDPFSFTLDRNKPKGVVLYTALNNGAKVAIQKVDPKGNVVPGATFELYKEGTPDQAEKLVKDKDTAGTYLPLEELDPGSYYLLNTNGGAHAGEQLPFPYKFTVASGGSDGIITLSEQTRNSGLVQLFTPDGTNSSGGADSLPPTGRWTIQLADVSVGNLPLTGGARPWVILAGLALLVAGAVRAFKQK